MAILRIPLPQGLPQFVQQVPLDGRTYTLRFHWNEREESWYMELADAEDVTIIAARKLVANWPLLHRRPDERKPPGELFVIDATGPGVDPGLQDLDQRVQLQYFDAEEMEQYR